MEIIEKTIWVMFNIELIKPYLSPVLFPWLASSF